MRHWLLGRRGRGLTKVERTGAQAETCPRVIRRIVASKLTRLRTRAPCSRSRPTRRRTLRSLQRGALSNFSLGGGTVGGGVAVVSLMLTYSNFWHFQIPNMTIKSIRLFMRWRG